MTREKRLGRGLEALLGRVGTPETDLDREITSAETYGAGTQGTDREDGRFRADVRNVSVFEIEKNPFQPRRDFDEEEIARLADSLQQHGLLQPLVVRRVGTGYQLIAGERRLRAAIRAGWTEVPVRVVDAEDRQMAELAIVENLQRKDLNALEKAECFQRYIETYDVSQEELAARLDLDRSTISNFLRLLDLPPRVQEALRENRITQGHARAILGLESEEEQIELCRLAEAESLSVRKVEAIVQERRGRGGPLLSVVGRDGKATPARPAANEHLEALEQQFRAALGSKVVLSHNGRGRGKIVIHFRSHEEFERIRTHICGQGDVAADAI
ncbi:MAG: ParB/RepB/Spo0J family partition protein [Thermogutta sp.]